MDINKPAAGQVGKFVEFDEPKPATLFGRRSKFADRQDSQPIKSSRDERDSYSRSRGLKNVNSLVSSNTLRGNTGMQGE